MIGASGYDQRNEDQVWKKWPGPQRRGLREENLFILHLPQGDTGQVAAIKLGMLLPNVIVGTEPFTYTSASPNLWPGCVGEPQRKVSGMSFSLIVLDYGFPGVSPMNYLSTKPSLPINDFYY